ncbi:MAG: peptidoglycan-binding protein [Eubacteriales bacterium]
MNKKILNNPVVRNIRKYYQIIEIYLMKKMKSRFFLFGFVSVLIVMMVLAFSLPKIMAAAQKSNSDTLAASLNTQTSISEPASTPTAIPTPEPTPTPTPTPDPTLKQGDENERVQQLQERLMELNFLDLDESTQRYGPATEYAVELFQRQHELAQDGIAGPATLDLLYSDAAKKYTLLKGTVGSDVDSLQRQLIDLGYLDNATGYYGTETVAAVTAFQERNGLSVDGKTGEQTLSLIYSPNAVESATKVKEAIRYANIQTFLDVAANQLGDPYIAGNVGPNSFDCSGLVYYCLQQAGSSRGRYNAAGYSQVDDWEKITSMDDLQIGDILFFHTNGKTVGHTGIYIGNGEMIDASSSNGKVVQRSCFSSFWEKNFVVARRPW